MSCRYAEVSCSRPLEHACCAIRHDPVRRSPRTLWKASEEQGRLLTRLADPDFSVPTTIDDHGKRLWAVNARFGTPNPGTAEYQVVQIGKPKVK